MAQYDVYANPSSGAGNGIGWDGEAELSDDKLVAVGVGVQGN